MSAPRFFYPQPLSPNQTFEFPSELAHYALRVLRLRDGASVILFDGHGGQYTAQLSVEGKKAQAHTSDLSPVDVELQGDITLVQGVATGDKMDWIVEKAVELGAKRLVPIAAQRSVLQLSGERLLKRHEHWQRVAQSASEQCGRNRIMEVEMPMTLATFLQETGHSQNRLTLFCDPEGQRGLDELLPTAAAAITLLVGPEGGWTPEEHQYAMDAGAVGVRFGQRVLRTETAGLALIAAITALQGWS